MMQEHAQTDNEKMLDEVVQNTELGKNTLDELQGLTADPALKAEMTRQLNRYRSLNQQAHTALAAIGAKAKGQSAFAKMNVSMGIRTKTLTDKSTRNLAEMLVEGCDQGVLDCRRAAEDYPAASVGAQKLLEELEQFQETARESWMQFL